MPYPALPELKREIKMAKQPEELRKLVAVATDSGLAVKLRLKAIELVGNMGTHEALLALLDVAGNEHLTTEERQLALKYARTIVRSER